jgi:hypothetical protein
MEGTIMVETNQTLVISLEMGIVMEETTIMEEIAPIHLETNQTSVTSLGMEIAMVGIIMEAIMEVTAEVFSTFFLALAMEMVATTTGPTPNRILDLLIMTLH